MHFNIGLIFGCFFGLEYFKIFHHAREPFFVSSNIYILLHRSSLSGWSFCNCGMAGVHFNLHKSSTAYIFNISVNKFDL